MSKKGLKVSLRGPKISQENSKVVLKKLKALTKWT